MPVPFIGRHGDEKIVGMNEYLGWLFIATTRCVYRLNDEGTAFEPFQTNKVNKRG